MFYLWSLFAGAPGSCVSKVGKRTRPRWAGLTVAWGRSLQGTLLMKKAVTAPRFEDDFPSCTDFGSCPACL